MTGLAIKQTIRIGTDVRVCYTPAVIANVAKLTALKDLRFKCVVLPSCFILVKICIPLQLAAFLLLCVLCIACNPEVVLPSTCFDVSNADVWNVELPFKATDFDRCTTYYYQKLITISIT